MTQNNRVIDSDSFTDTTTGEVGEPTDIIPHSALDARLAKLRDAESTLPIHEQMLDTMNNSSQVVQALTDAYYGTPPRKFDDFLNVEVTFLGMIIQEMPPFHGKDGLDHPGYYCVLMLSLDEKGNPIIIKSGSDLLAMQVFHIMKGHGWWLFDEEQTYKLRKGESGAHFIDNTKHPLKGVLLSEKVGKNE